MNAETSALVRVPRPKAFAGTGVAVHSISPATGSSSARLHHLWLASWETALAALTIASQTGTLSPNDAAAHRAVIAAERDVVTKQLALLGW
jgi:hypothetical protein